MPPDLLAHDRDQFGVAGLVAVGDRQADDPLAPQMSGEPIGQPPPMRRLHHEDRIGPVEQVGRDRLGRVAVEPGRSGDAAGEVGIASRRRLIDRRLRGRAALEVAGADEEQSNEDVSKIRTGSERPYRVGFGASLASPKPTYPNN